MMLNNIKIAVVGLGYVGLPLAVAFSEKFEVIGFDIDKDKVTKYQNNIDPTNEIGSAGLKETNVKFTYDERDLAEANFYVITVPTPIKPDNTPNLFPIESATKLVGKYIDKHDYVVYESTVYPGVTEDVCTPLLSEVSGLRPVEEFKVGYSPERINPGDKVNTVKNIIKIVSGIDSESLEVIAQVYEAVIEAGVHRAGSIKVAESAKVVENSQRDLNIAFMNELAQAFDLMGINTNEVVDAMNTKWNALGFYPGLVGGHCIGVDPYYFIYQAENLGYHSQLISSGRKINNYMSKFVAANIIKELVKNDLITNAKVVIYGLTFKEDTPDFRNSKLFDVVSELNEYGIQPTIVDPYIESLDQSIDAQLVKETNEIKSDITLMLYAVDHKEFKKIKDQEFLNKLDSQKSIIVDLKNRFKKYESDKIIYWAL